MSFILFDYTVSAMKNAVYSFRPRFTVWQEPDLLFEKKNLLGAPILHAYSPHQYLQKFSLVFLLS